MTTTEALGCDNIENYAFELGDLCFTATVSRFPDSRLGEYLASLGHRVPVAIPIWAPQCGLSRLRSTISRPIWSGSWLAYRTGRRERSVRASSPRPGSG